MPNFYNKLRARKFNTTTDTALEISALTSATPNFTIDASGKINWSSGSATADTNLYRSAANVLKTDDSFNVAVGQTYKIDGDDVLTKTSLGTTVVGSSLTSLGSLSSLNAATPNFSGPLLSSGISTFSSAVSVSGSLSAATPSFNGPFISSGSSTFSSGITVNGTANLQQIKEKINDGTISANILTCDYSIAGIFYTSATANFTLNITNLPTDNGSATTVTVIVSQGSTAGYPINFQISGLPQIIQWSNNNAIPTPSANKTDIFTFTLIRRSSIWTVLGSYSLKY